MLGWFFSRNFRKPLAQLSLLTKEISDGNLPNIKKLDAHNEIEILNNQFIDMIQVLREKNAQIVEAHKELEKSAITDALTGLHNRRYFEKKLIKVLENCNVGTKECALCYFDLDQFKIVNDSCGHEAGDELLCQLTSILDTRVRGTDVLARLGGDEFGLILTDINEDQSISVAEDIKKLISEYQFVWEDKIFTVGVSIGIIAINSKSKDVADIMRKADIACYTAKHEGRNRVHYYREMDIHTNTLTVEIDWIHKLQDALRNNRFELWFQSIAKTDYSENNNHIEILLRLKDEEGKIILPNNFIPAAERYQLMPQIDRWVISNMFSLLQKTDHYLQNTLFSINLSGLSLTDSTLFDFIKNEFKEKNIDPSIICFEITETAAIRKLSSAISLVSQLRELDCKFALDDFGAGLTSFKHLKYLPVDFIKIDGSFVSKIVDDPIDEGMVEAINKVAQLMRKETIAEYVENQEIRNKLVGLGVDYIQGYLIDKPRPINEYFSVKMKKTIQLVSV